MAFVWGWKLDLTIRGNVFGFSILMKISKSSWYVFFARQEGECLGGVLEGSALNRSTRGENGGSLASRPRAGADIFMAREVGGEEYANSGWQVRSVVRRGWYREKEEEGTNDMLFFSQVDVASVFSCGCKGHARESTRNARRGALSHPFLLPPSLFLSLAWSDRLPIVTGGSGVFRRWESLTTPTLGTRARRRRRPRRRAKDFPTASHLYTPSCLPAIRHVNGGQRKTRSCRATLRSLGHPLDFQRPRAPFRER